MSVARVERRLAAILAADIVAYSRLIEKDEAQTLAAVRYLLANVIGPLVLDHRGRIVKLVGDGAIMEFASAVDAVSCAVAIQQAVAAEQRARPSESRIVFRMGINVGDVVVEGDDLLGDGVNIAARLEGLAEPGGICIAGAVCEQLAGKTDIAFEDAGERQLKNISRPVRVWRWQGTQAPAGPTPAPLPEERPSIAVLPFDNLSGEPDETYFSDGITEDIITGLARFRSLIVIARHSSFSFRGQAVELAEIGRRLGASFLLEGSVRRVGQRLRITAQLIEASSGAHLWAERYDRSLDDVFAVQDEVAQMIVATLVGRIEAAKLQQSMRRPTVDAAAYDCVLRGILHLRGYGKDDNETAFRMFEEAARLDPGYAVAHAFAGLAAMHRGEADGSMGLADYALERALTGIRLDPQDSRCHGVLAIIRLYRREYDLAEHHVRQAIASNPNAADEIALLALVMNVRGRPDEAHHWFDRAVRLNPFHPPYHHGIRGGAFFLQRRYKEAIDAYKLVPGLNVTLRSRLAACHGLLGEVAEARAQVDLLLRDEPNAIAVDFVNRDFMYERAEDREHFRDGLIKAGMTV